jgi:hypothetical protein
MSERDFYIHAVVDDVAMSFYIEASSSTEASNEAMRTLQRRFPGKRIELRIVEKLSTAGDLPSERKRWVNSSNPKEACGRSARLIRDPSCAPHE